MYVTNLQLALLRQLWKREECPVAVVQAGLLPETALTHTTVATLLRRLERRGVVASRLSGRRWLFRALLSEADVRTAMLDSLVENLFEGRRAALLAHILHESTHTDADVVRLRDFTRELLEAAAHARNDAETSNHDPS